MSEKNKALVRRGIDEVWNGGNRTAVDELVSADFVVHASRPGNEIHGREGVAAYFASLRTAFPDLQFTVEDSIAEDDRVVTRWSARGTHRGEFQGIAPTDKPVTVNGIDIDRIAGDQVIECWMQLDELGLLQQLGVIRTPE